MTITEQPQAHPFRRGPEQDPEPPERLVLTVAEAGAVLGISRGAFGDAGYVGSLPANGVHVTDVVGAVPT